MYQFQRTVSLTVAFPGFGSKVRAQN